MDKAEIDLLILSYFRFRQVGIKNEDGPSHVWAVEKLNALYAGNDNPSASKENYELLWTILLQMLEMAGTRDHLTCVAYHTEKIIHLNRTDAMDRIARTVQINPRLSYAVSHIYTTDSELREQLKELGCPWAVSGFLDETEELLQHELQPLVEGWLKFARAKTDTDREEFRWAQNQLLDDSFDFPNRCWKAILLLVAACEKKRELGYLTDPLATLLSGGSGVHYLEVAASEVLSNKKFAFVVTKLKSDQLARAGWLQYWSEVIALAETRLTDDPMTAREL